MASAPHGAETWRPFVLGRCHHRPHATYPDGELETALRVAPRPSLFGLAPGGVCRAASVAGRAVGSYPTLSPLPRRLRGEAVCFLWHFPWGRPRRSLSGTVSPWSPDFPHPLPFGCCRRGRPAGWQCV